MQKQPEEWAWGAQVRFEALCLNRSELTIILAAEDEALPEAYRNQCRILLCETERQLHELKYGRGVGQ